MQYIVDNELGGHVMLFASPIEMVEQTIAKQSRSNCWKPGFNDSAWTGRSLKNWQGTLEAMVNPWEEGLAMVEQMRQDLQAAGLPKPKDRRRRMRYDEYDGQEIDVERYRSGEPYWRRAKRELTHGPSTVSLISNLDAEGSMNAKDILFRGAAVVAVCDILEAHGYRVDLWAWCRGRNVYKGKGDAQFTAFNLKKPEQPIDVGTLINALSGWFLRVCVFGSFITATETTNPGVGGAVYQMGGFSKYMAYASDRVLPMPSVWTMKDAVEAAQSMLRDFANADDVAAMDARKCLTY